MLDMKKFLLKGLLIPCVLLFAAGCEKEFGRDGVTIRLNVIAEGTKAATVTTDDLNTTGESFTMTAVADGNWKDNETNLTTTAGTYFTDAVEYDGSEWDLLTDHMWLNDVSLHFWSYYPKDADLHGTRSISTPVAAADYINFTYELPAAVAGTDATNQEDLIFAGNKEKRTFDDEGDIDSYTSSNTAYTRTDNEVDIVFHHALSKINFMVSPDDGTYDTNLKIRSIRLSNVSGKGDCKFTLPETFEWSNWSDLKNYSQNYGDVAFTSAPTGWAVGDFDSHTKTRYTCENAFFMIPQDLSTASVDVTFTDGTDVMTKTVALKNPSDPKTGKWEADHYYTYKIAAEITVDISLSLSLIDWGLITKEIDLDEAVSTSTGGQLELTPKTKPTDPDCRDAVADGGEVAATFQLDSPIGATWFVSVTNTDAFVVVNTDNGSTNPAFGTINGAPQTFYIKPKTGVDRSKTQKTKVSVALRLADGTMMNIDSQIGNVDVSPNKAWNIILNPIK